MLILGALFHELDYKALETVSDTLEIRIIVGMLTTANYVAMYMLSLISLTQLTTINKNSVIVELTSYHSS